MSVEAKKLASSWMIPTKEGTPPEFIIIDGAEHTREK